MNIKPKNAAALVLSAPDAQFRDAVILGQGLPLEKDGHPVRYYWKEVLRLGSYLDKNQTPFQIDAPRVDNLLNNFKRAKAKGFEPYVPDGHNSTKNFGFVVDARKNESGGLELLHQLVGDDAILAASRNKSSIFTVKDFTDETGEKFDELIIHNAICPDPQLSNLEDFKPALAASRGMTAEAVVLQLASTRSPEMDLTKLRESTGAAKEIPDDKVIEMAVAKLNEGKTALELSKAKEGDTNKAIERALTAEAALSAMKKMCETADAKVLELSRAPDAYILGEFHKLASQKVDLCLERGQCVKAQADILKAAIIDGDKPNALMLSKSGPLGTPIDVALKVLELNKPFTGSITGMQQQDPNATASAAEEGRKAGAAYQADQLKARGMQTA